MNVLIACEESQTVCKEFRALGHNAWSCDTEPPSGGHPEWHLQCDVRIPLSAKKKDGNCYWDLIIAHPPCTFLTNAANRWLYESCSTSTPEQRWAGMKEGVAFFNLFYNHPCEKIAIENPKPTKHANLPEKSQMVHPHFFGDPETKETHLWLKGLPPLIRTHWMKKEEIKNSTHLMGFSKKDPKLRSRLRSKTFIGLAKAMAKHWSNGE